MVKQIIGETFEKLGQTIGQTAQQIVQEPGKMAETAAKQVGIQSETGVEQPQGQALNPAQQAQKETKRRRQLAAFQAELGDIQRQQVQELPRQITGKPGFSEERMIRQLKMKEEENLPPAVAMAKRKGGTGERRIPGGSG